MTIDERLNDLTAVHAETAAFINQLARIAEPHEHRTDRFDEVLRAAAEERRAGAEESLAADRRLRTKIDQLRESIAALVSVFGEFIRQRPSPQQ